jgi:hypothetical protein
VRCIASFSRNESIGFRAADSIIAMQMHHGHADEKSKMAAVPAVFACPGDPRI